MWQSNAQENCNNHIVNGVKGRLFEPRTLATNDLVFSNFTSVHGNQNIFIGIDDINQTNKWVYSASGDNATFTNWHPSQPNDNLAHCVHFWDAHPKLWGDIGCSVNLASICEFRSGKKVKKANNLQNTPCFKTFSKYHNTSESSIESAKFKMFYPYK